MQQTKSRVISLVTPLLIYSISFAYEYILELIDLQRVRRNGQVNSDR
jgi:fibrillarin-like rRNA methylase